MANLTDKQLAAKTVALQLKIADEEASLGAHKAALARLEAKLSGEPAPECGLDKLWDAALPKSRERSSKHQCRVAWNRIPPHQRPPLSQAIAALAAWNRSEQWRAEGNAYAPGLHRYISNRMWETLPESSATRSRYCAPPAKPAPPVDPADLVTDPAEIAKLLKLDYPLRVRS